MVRQFKTADYPSMLKQRVLIEDCLPPSHLARFVVEEVSALDLSEIYLAYGPKGGMAIAPEILLGLLFYGYATGVMSSRAIERATHESIPFRFIASNLHPDHDTISHFRTRFLNQIEELFIQLLERAVTSNILSLESISVDGTKIHADASKSKAVSYKRLGEIQSQLAQEIEELQNRVVAIEPKAGGFSVADEIARRQQQLVRLGEAEEVLIERAQERYQQEQIVYATLLSEREAYTARTGKKPTGKLPIAPFLGFVTKTNITSLTRNHE